MHVAGMFVGAGRVTTICTRYSLDFLADVTLPELRGERDADSWPAASSAMVKILWPCGALETRIGC
jgi:hypothetical protein